MPVLMNMGAPVRVNAATVSTKLAELKLKPSRLNGAYRRLVQLSQLHFDTYEILLTNMRQIFAMDDLTLTLYLPDVPLLSSMASNGDKARLESYEFARILVQKHHLIDPEKLDLDLRSLPSILQSSRG